MKPFSLTIRGTLRQYDSPAVMGILNITPDSFYEGSRAFDPSEIKARVETMVEEGVDFIDIGAYSTRPGCSDVDESDELRRLEAGMKILRDIAPDIPVSVDTFRASVAHRAVRELSADIVNDISCGAIDPDMFRTVADLKVPYILMHMRGTPATMLEHTDYVDLMSDIMRDLAFRISELYLLGVNDIIIDPGFGFSKTLDQNYLILKDLKIGRAHV